MNILIKVRYFIIMHFMSTITDLVIRYTTNYFGKHIYNTDHMISIIFLSDATYHFLQKSNTNRLTGILIRSI